MRVESFLLILRQSFKSNRSFASKADARRKLLKKRSKAVELDERVLPVVRL